MSIFTGPATKFITRVRDPFTGRKDTFIRLPFGRILMIGG